MRYTLSIKWINGAVEIISCSNYRVHEGVLRIWLSDGYGLNVDQRMIPLSSILEWAVTS